MKLVFKLLFFLFAAGFIFAVIRLRVTAHTEFFARSVTKRLPSL